MNLEELYNHFVVVIDEAKSKRHIYLVPEAAEAAEMQGGEISRGLSQKWEYKLSSGEMELTVHARWYDQSKPFSIRPDKHIMSVELKGPGVDQAHSQVYEE